MKLSLSRSIALAFSLAFCSIASFAQYGAPVAQSNAPVAQSNAPVILHAPEAAKAMPDSVFFRGQSALVQGRNSAGIHFPDDMYVLTALVDTSGYSSGIQQKYQAYFITEVPLNFSGHTLQPGAYGAGITNAGFTVMDVAAHDLFTVPVTHDDVIKRPTPLQLDADGGHYRLYFGRNYVTFAQAK
jgi:hypothetical protein